MTTDIDNISRLKFIGKIKKGEKINIKYMFVQPNNFITKITRSFYYCDNRINTLNFIIDTIKNVFDELNKYINNPTSFNINITNNIIIDFENCKTGLDNLKDTYHEDLMFCCKIDRLIQDIDARLDDIKINKKITSQSISIQTSINKSINVITKPSSIYTPDSREYTPPNSIE